VSAAQPARERGEAVASEPPASTPALHAVDTDTVDLWRLVGLPGGLVEASYLVGPLAAQYRLIVDVLLAQQPQSYAYGCSGAFRGLGVESRK
jgi:hypothetical protein